MQTIWKLYHVADEPSEENSITCENNNLFANFFNSIKLE